MGAVREVLMWVDLVPLQPGGARRPVVVADRGPGVPPELLPSLFERFARSERAQEAAAGTGLGLAIARSYARAHRGEVVYESAAPHGARFEHVLPHEPGSADVEAHRRWVAVSLSPTTANTEVGSS